jgi:hypothetical protein
MKVLKEFGKWLVGAPSRIVTTLVVLFLVYGALNGQLQQSAGSPFPVTQSGNWSIRLQDGSGNLISSTAGALNVSSVVGAGSAIIGWVRVIPPGCFAQSTPFNFRAVQVATGGGSVLTSTTSCAVSCFVNNITNVAATIRIQDGQGTPVIWAGGNADFSLLANSNTRLPFSEGTIFTSGITAIAGTATALNINCTVFQ